MDVIVIASLYNQMVSENVFKKKSYMPVIKGRGVSDLPLAVLSGSGLFGLSGRQDQNFMHKISPVRGPCF